jgi:branched-chain amino acid transport system substrate-binding protein
MKFRSIGLCGLAVALAAMLVIPALGCGGGETAAPGGEPIVLGIPTSLGYWFGDGSVNSCTLAIEEINKAGGVSIGGIKRPFKLEVIDTRDSAPGVPTEDSLRAIEKLILEKKPVGIVTGPNRSEVVLAAMDLISKYKMPLISTLPKSPSLAAKVTENYDKYKYFFHLTTDSNYMADYHIAYMKAVRDLYGVNKVFCMSQDILWAKGTATLIATKLKDDKSFEVVGNDSQPLGLTDFSMILSKIKAAGNTQIPAFYDMPEVAQLMSQWATMKIPGYPVGVIGPLLDKTIWKTTGGQVESVALHVCEAGTFPVKSIPKSVDFYNNYTKRFGAAPDGVAGFGVAYDSVYLYKYAIEKAQSLDPDSIVTALEQTNADGTIGHITFLKNHQAPYGLDPTKTAIGVFVQWQQPGELKLVYPTEVAEAKIQAPAWLRK